MKGRRYLQMFNVYGNDQGIRMKGDVDSQINL